MGAVARMLLAALLTLAACGGGDQPPAFLFFDLVYLDDCGCPFDNVDLTGGATASALVEEASTFSSLNDTCVDLPASQSNTLLSIEPLLPEDQDLVFEDIGAVNVFVEVFAPPIGETECAQCFGDGELSGESINVRLTGDDQIIQVEMSCAGRALPCF